MNGIHASLDEKCLGQRKMDSRVASFYAVWIEESKITLDTIMHVFQSAQYILKDRIKAEATVLFVFE